MKEAKGSIWDSGAQAIVIPTNMIRSPFGQAVMGAGLALEARNRFGTITGDLGRQMAAHGPEHVYSFDYGVGYEIVCFPTKTHWRVPSKITVIEDSLSDLLDIVDDKGWTQIALPRIGCGIYTGQLRWTDVKELIEPHLDDRFTVWTP